MFVVIVVVADDGAASDNIYMCATSVITFFIYQTYTIKHIFSGHSNSPIIIKKQVSTNKHGY